MHPIADDLEGPSLPSHVDVVIVGAGLSGIGAAVHLRSRLPGKTFVILEARDALGGTWDLFRYPGIRSDSDMYTLGYAFKPWTNAKAIADGPAIKAYIAETAAEHGVDRAIRYGRRVVSANWSSDDARWTLDISQTKGTAARMTCGLLFMCSGYYSYAQGYRPEWPGESDFTGRIVHPQFWPDDLDYRDRRVVVIGSGATAVTLVPEMATTAAHVTMLQRSPTYIVARPSVDAIAEKLKRKLSATSAYALTRWKNILLGRYFYGLARRKPDRFKAGLLGLARRELGPDFDIARHLTPTYKPWDQRLCLVPDADFYKAIRSGRASIATDTIERFTPSGLRLGCGKDIAADIVVTATGLKLNLLGDVTVVVDGKTVDLSKAMNYRGCMFSDVPNLITVFGYTNASWTLKADLMSDYACRLLKYMDAKGTPIAVPVRDPSVPNEPFLDFTSGYVARAIDTLPKQGSKHPWRLYQNYLRDLLSFRFGRVADGTISFRRAGEHRATTELAA